MKAYTENKRLHKCCSLGTRSEWSAL